VPSFTIDTSLLYTQFVYAVMHAVYGSEREHADDDNYAVKISGWIVASSWRENDPSISPVTVACNSRTSGSAKH
jgi:hypothetical protein